MKENLKAIFTFVLAVFAVSLLAVALNNFIVTFPIARKTVSAVNNLGELTTLTAEVAKKNSGAIYMLDGDIESIYQDLNDQLDVSRDMFNYFRKNLLIQDEINKGIYILLEEQTKHILTLEKKVDNIEVKYLELKKSHFELLREVAYMSRDIKEIKEKLVEHDKVWEGLYDMLQDGKTPWEVKK